jgi:restriction endonuclease S subunit/predicted nucleic acid-binding protein
MIFYKETNFKETPIGRIPKDWELVKFSNIAEDIYYGITAKAVENKTGLKMLRTTDIKDYSVDWDSLPFCEVTEKRCDIQRFLLKEGDLIIARAGTTGVSVLVEKNFENVIFGSYLIKVRLSRKVHPKFMHYFCQSHLYWDHIISGQAGSTLKNINLPILKSLNIPIPSLEEQKAIAEILSTVDEAIQKTNEVIAKTERLKKGLMQELLTKGLVLGFMFDTNIFNAILDRHIDLKQLPRNLKYYVTHIQYDEIYNTQDEERRRELLEIMEKVPSEFIVTEGAAYDVSKYGMAKYMSEAYAKQYNEMLRRLKELDEKSGKKKSPENHVRDILIALTCMKNCLTLVTNDENLKEVAQEFQCSVITFEQLLEGEYREFKDTQIGKIPAHWRVIEVGDILSLEYGRGLPERERMPGTYPVVGSNGIVGYHNQAIVKGPGIVIGRKGTIGAVSWIDQDFWPIDTTYYVKTKSSNIFLKWLFYELIYLNPARFHLADVVPGLKRELVYLLKMPLPPFPEQQKIAEIISIIDKKLELERNEKAKLEKVKQGLMDLLLTGKIRVKV